MSAHKAIQGFCRPAPSSGMQATPLTWRRSLSAYLLLPMMPRLGVVTRYGCRARERRSSLYRNAGQASAQAAWGRHGWWSWWKHVGHWSVHSLKRLDQHAAAWMQHTAHTAPATAHTPAAAPRAAPAAASSPGSCAGLAPAQGPGAGLLTAAEPCPGPPAAKNLDDDSCKLTMTLDSSHLHLPKTYSGRGKGSNVRLDGVWETLDSRQADISAANQAARTGQHQQSIIHLLRMDRCSTLLPVRCGV